MTRKNILSFLLILITATYSFSFDTSSIKYMPLHVGDFWIYSGSSYSNLGGSSQWIDKIIVTQNINFNNHKYYFINSNNQYLFISGYYRTDSTTGSLYIYDTSGSCPYYNHEKLIDSLAALNGDSVKNCNYNQYKCTGSQSVLIFGDSTSNISFLYSYVGINWGTNITKKYTKHFGFLTFNENQYAPTYVGNYILNLKGCKINGVIFGDTSTVSVNKISEDIPSEFKLYQNYPNPFNPVTKIGFDIPNNSNVKLIVTDILGREIVQLVNEKLTAGFYEYEFDAGNLASGIYFYRVEAENYFQVKKMVLIK